MAYRKMITLVDLDVTAYDFLNPVLDTYNNRYDDRLTIEDLTDYTIGNLVKPECGARGLEEIWAEPGFFYNLSPSEGAVEAIKAAEETGHVMHVFLSICTTPTGAYEKIEAIKRDFPFIDPRHVLISAGIKGVVKGDLLVDDGPHNHAEFQRMSAGLTCVMDMPYNRDVKANFRMRNWAEHYPQVIARSLTNFWGRQQRIQMHIDAEKGGTN
jgi:5'(3')-deoxyribonucleotidase